MQVLGFECNRTVCAVAAVAAVLLLRRLLRRRVRPLAGKVVVVTGASSGIGEALCDRLAAAKAHVVLAARRRERLDEVAKRLAAAGAASTLVVPCDILQEADRAALVRQTVAKHGRLDCVVLNAATGAIIEFDESERVMGIIRDTMEINFFANVRLVQLALPHLVAAKGCVVNISSLAGVLNTPFRTAYGAAKHACMGFFGALRGEVQAKGVQVTVICPGFVLTEFHDHVKTNDGRPPARNRGGFMTAHECARQVLDAVEHGDDELIMTAGGKLAYMLRPFAPRFFDGLVRRQAMKSVKLDA